MPGREAKHADASASALGGAPEEYAPATLDADLRSLYLRGGPNLADCDAADVESGDSRAPRVAGPPDAAVLAGEALAALADPTLLRARAGETPALFEERKGEPTCAKFAPLWAELAQDCLARGSAEQESRRALLLAIAGLALAIAIRRIDQSSATEAFFGGSLWEECRSLSGAMDKPEDLRICARVLSLGLTGTPTNTDLLPILELHLSYAVAARRQTAGDRPEPLDRLVAVSPSTCKLAHYPERVRDWETDPILGAAFRDRRVRFEAAAKRAFGVPFGAFDRTLGLRVRAWLTSPPPVGEGLSAKEADTRRLADIAARLEQGAADAGKPLSREWTFHSTREPLFNEDDVWHALSRAAGALEANPSWLHEKRPEYADGLNARVINRLVAEAGLAHGTVFVPLEVPDLYDQVQERRIEVRHPDGVDAITITTWNRSAGAIPGAAAVARVVAILRAWLDLRGKRGPVTAQPQSPAMSTVVPATTGSFESASDLARRYGLPEATVKKRLERWRMKHRGGEGFVEPGNRTKNSPQFLYDVRAVAELLAKPPRRRRSSR
jgi:hypothetical protein